MTKKDFKKYDGYMHYTWETIESYAKLIDKYADAFCKIRNMPIEELDKTELRKTIEWTKNSIVDLDGLNDFTKTINLAENLIQLSYLQYKSSLDILDKTILKK